MLKKSFLAFCFLIPALATSAYASSEEKLSPDDAPAELVNSEFMHQAEAGVFELTPNYGSLYSQYDVRTAGLDAKLTGGQVGIAAEYGFNSLFSLEFALSYLSKTTSLTCTGTCNDVHQKGLVNPELTAKFKVPVGQGTLKAGADLSISLEKSKTDSSDDSNTDSGGTTLTPYVAYELPVGPGYLGARARYDAYKSDAKYEDATFSPTVTGTRTGGNAFNLAVYYETAPAKITYGAALEYESVIQTKSTPDGGSESSNNDAFTGFGIDLYLPLHISQRFTILPILQYLKADYSSSSYSLKSVSALAFNMGLRITL